jgi:hypothetical protein
MPGLWVPPAGLAYVQSNLQATPSTTVPGTSLALGATPHTKTAWASLIDPVSADVYMMAIGFAGTGAAATASRTLVDIGIGPTGGGTEQVLLPNLLAGHAAAWSNLGMCRIVTLPIYVPRGSRISVRAQSVRASFTMSIMCWVWGGPTSPPWWVAVGCDAYGPDTATSAGVAHTAGNTGAESAYASIGSTTSKNYDAIFAMAQCDSNTVKTALAYHFEFGAGSTTIGEFYCQTTTSEILTGLWPNPVMYQQIPSGTQLQARGECSGTAEAQDLALYGLY